ncbi:MAG: hypothetical protein JOZ45_15165, partial [Acidobacteriaceae bacterium]|nr:hypothetical protein [Acidobacteriaceae bacterium]
MSSFSRSSPFIALAALTICGIGGWQSAIASQDPQPPSNPVAAPGQDGVIRVNVELVNILFTVKAKKGGQLIPNLEKQNFTVYEDGKQQTIQRFSRETDLPLTLGLLIDISAS